MTINLNKKLVSKEELNKYIDDIDVYRYYTNKEVKFGSPINSPLREDNKPSFGYFIGESGEICFNDFVLGSGNYVRFVELMFGLNYFEALSKIVIDFDLRKHFYIKEVDKTSKDYNPNKFENREKLISRSNNFRLGKKKREWKLYDLVFWKQFGIDIEVLEKYRVEPISYIFINGNPILADKHAYCFIERKDDLETYKIYQPFNKNYKWLNNHNSSVWQGWEQLPKKGNTLIITKSLKDVMSIVNTTGIASVSLQTESSRPKQNIVEELEQRFKTIYLLYDNDFDKEVNWGRKFGEAMCEQFNMIQIEIPTNLKSKDYSDLVKNHGEEKSEKLLNKLLLPF